MSAPRSPREHLLVGRGTQSVAISHNQMQSEPREHWPASNASTYVTAISRNQSQSVAISRNQTQSDAIRRNQTCKQRIHHVTQRGIYQRQHRFVKASSRVGERCGHWRFARSTKAARRKSRHGHVVGEESFRSLSPCGLGIQPERIRGVQLRHVADAAQRPGIAVDRGRVGGSVWSRLAASDLRREIVQVCVSGTLGWACRHRGQSGAISGSPQSQAPVAAGHARGCKSPTGYGGRTGEPPSHETSAPN